MSATLAERCRLLEARLASVPQALGVRLRASKPRGGYFVWVEFEGDLPSGFDTLEMWKFAQVRCPALAQVRCPALAQVRRPAWC